MALDIIRTRDRAKLVADDIAKIIKQYVEDTTGRKVYAVEFHAGRGELGAATIHFEFAPEHD